MKAWLVVAAVLTLVVCAASAALRLSTAGVGCAPWPACQQPHLAAATSGAAAEAALAAPSWHEPVRLAHRISATVAGLMYLLALLFGWARWSAAQRGAGVALLAVSVGLAWLGRYTPSDRPAVVIGNLLGGHLLLALLTLLIASLATVAHRRAASDAAAGAAPMQAGAANARPRSSRTPWGVLVVIVAVQIALGALVSARAAGAACAQGCSLAALLTGAAIAFDPTVGLAALPSAAAHAIERQAVLVAHIGVGLLLLVGSAASWRVARSSARALPLALALAAAGVGATMAWAAYPLSAAVAHSLLAAATLCAVTWAWARARTTV